jgi:tRNA A-37 threonylcarbamoyl transferase component Bud32
MPGPNEKHIDDSGALDRTAAPTDADAAPEGLAPGVDADDGYLVPGRVIAGRFKVLSLLGKGGMGAVYRVHQTSVDRQAALKILHPHMARDPLLVKRFEVEARAASRIIHPNGIVVYDFGREPDGLCFLAMEFVEGRSLRDVLKAERRFKARRAVAVLDQILAYLEELHGAGIVHRDLKPDNVFLLEGKGDRAKVIDFGLAKVADPGAADNLTRAGAIFGTAHYMSPEQGVGDPVDARSDLYACGIILYELLAGKPPFSGGQATQIIGRHVVMPPPHPHQVNAEADLPPGLWEVLQTVLAKQPKDRPANAAALRALLAGFLLDAPAGGGSGPVPIAGPEGTPLHGTTLPPIAAKLAAGPAPAPQEVPAPTMAPSTRPPVSRWPGGVEEPAEARARARAQALARGDAEPVEADTDGEAAGGDDAETTPPSGPLEGENLIAILNEIFAALEGVVGPMADFVLRDALASLQLGVEGPPDAMTRAQLAQLVEVASQSVPAGRRDDFRERARGTFETEP